MQYVINACTSYVHLFPRECRRINVFIQYTHNRISSLLSQKKSEQIIDGDNTELDMYRDEIHGCLVAHLNRGSRSMYLFLDLSLSLPLSLSLSFSLIEDEGTTTALIFAIGDYRPGYREPSLTRRAILKNATCFPPSPSPSLSPLSLSVGLRLPPLDLSRSPSHRFPFPLLLISA